VEAGVGYDDYQVLQNAAAVERGSEHPLANAIVWEADAWGLAIPRAADVEVVPGKGVRGTVDGKRVVVGTLGFLKESGIHLQLMHSEAHRHRQEGRSVVYVGIGKECAGVIATSDDVRATSAEAVARLKAQGVRLVLLTGDDKQTADAVARKVGIDEVIADTLPAEKFAVVKKLKNEGRTVAVCGDGINDAPALAAADVGIAMGTGTDVAITTAGVTLVKPDLRAVSAARDLSRKTVATIRQNLTLAFVYNVLAIPVAAGLLVPFGGKLISPVWAAAAMSLSSVSVILNSLRLGRK
jgi:Cu+-exporting ATPase